MDETKKAALFVNDGVSVGVLSSGWQINSLDMEGGGWKGAGLQLIEKF